MNQAESPRHPLVTSLISGIMLTVFGFHPRVWAAESGTGVYRLGYQSSLSGYLPAPGFYLRNDFYVYQGNAKIVPFSLGPCLTFTGKIAGHDIGLNARYYNEVKVENRFNGQSCFLTLNLGI